MSCETAIRLDGVAAHAGWSGGTLLSLICRWAEATGYRQMLREHATYRLKGDGAGA